MVARACVKICTFSLFSLYGCSQSVVIYLKIRPKRKSYICTIILGLRANWARREKCTKPNTKSNLKPVTLELGGKSPFIVCEDADIDTAVEQAHLALFFNQGQCCCAGSRTYVHEKVYDEFLEKAKARTLKRVVGDLFKSGTEQGSQTDSKQFDKIMKYIRSGVDSGATLETGGEQFGKKGYYINPTVFSYVKDDMQIAQDEIFGPVQSILKFKDLYEVVRRANSSRYGLAAGVFSQNIDTANTLARALRVGTVWINCFDTFDATIPFGGYKMSGQGRKGRIRSQELLASEGSCDNIEESNMVINIILLSNFYK
ncbi:hypothetical protein KY284_023228 [Solanum tuberosum]|nr:hypothetical protein KY284_023228 [Solanum tuberosum]